MNLALLFVAFTALAQSNPSVGKPVENFAIRDHLGASRQLSDWRDSKLIVIAFLGVECPLAKLYTRRLNEISKEYGSRGVAVLGINANQHDQLRDIGLFVREHQVAFPLLKDSDNHVADLLGAKRTPEVFLLDGQRRIRYRGRVDDQYGIGVMRPKPTRRDLIEAIDQLLAGQPVSQPLTAAIGCIIDRRERRAISGTVTYTHDVAPVLYNHCVSCHREGAIAPFPLTNYQQTIGWAETIREVIEQGRMPPWQADPKHGKFLNDPRLSEQEKKQVIDWIQGGCPEGNPADLPLLPELSQGWNIPEPDLVLSMPEEFHVPAEGRSSISTSKSTPGSKKIAGSRPRRFGRAIVPWFIIAPFS